MDWKSEPHTLALEHPVLGKLDIEKIGEPDPSAGDYQFRINQDTGKFFTTEEARAHSAQSLDPFRAGPPIAWKIKFEADDL